MAVCWETRGCDEAMQADCPHATAIGDRCPQKCAFTQCDRSTYVFTCDPALIFSVDVDREAAIKEACHFCEHFLKHGPRLS